MNLTEQREAERRRLILLAPLIVAGNAFLFACMAVLAVVALRGGESLGMVSLRSDANQRIVREFLKTRVPDDRYRIWEWFPAVPLEENAVAVSGNSPSPATAGGFAQRVKFVVYGPSGARPLDTVYWIRNGRISRIMEAGFVARTDSRAGRIGAVSFQRAQQHISGATPWPG